MRTLRFAIIILPILFTAQACNLLLGTGEEGSGPRGVYKSTDGGESWQAASQISESDTLANAEVSRLIVEPSAPQNLLAATLNRGLYGSDNRAESWVQLLPSVAAYDAFFNPQNSQEIFISGIRQGVASVVKTPDRAASWVEVFSEPPGKTGVVNLAFDQENPSSFYAAISSGVILKSADAGGTWNVSSDLKDRIVGLTVVRGNVYALGRSKGLSRSSDGGRTWSQIKLSDQISRPHNDLAADSANASVLYVGSKSGLFRSQNGGADWQQLALPASPDASEVSAVAINPQNSQQIFAAIRAVIYRSDDSGATWRTVSLPSRRTISSIAIDPQEPNLIYAGLR